MKPSSAARVAEKPVNKTDKPAAKAGPKVFDVARPGKGTPSATSRPVIVTNRPILQDPMVSSSMEPDTKPSPAAVKVTIKPLMATDDPAESEKPSKPSADKTIAELAAENANEKTDEKTDGAEKPAAELLIKPAGAVDPDNKKTTDETESEADSAASEAETSESEAEKDTSSDESLNVDEAKSAKETAELEADAKKQEEINGLTESKQYFLPINSVERHRSKVMAILGLVLILALGLMLVDLLLDVGVIKIGGVHSLTHFFSS